MTTEELIAMLPSSLQADPEARAFLLGMFGPIARVDALLNRKTAGLALLLDPAECPDVVVPHLASLVGVGRELPAAATATLAELRKLVAVAMRFWKRKGTEQSWKDLVSTLAGSRSLLFDWFDLRTIEGSPAEVHTIPAPGTAPGGSYDYPERVSDLWYQDPASAVNADLLARFLAVARPTGERINLYAALLVDDFGAGPSQWAGTGSGSWTSDGDGHALSTADAYEYEPDLDGIEDSWSDYHLFLRLAVTGDCRVAWLTATAGTCYELGIDQVAGVLTLSRTIASVSTVIATYARPLAAGFPYRWSFEAWTGTGATTIRAYLEGVKIADVVDATAGRASAGPFSWGSTTTGSAAACTGALLWAHGTRATRIGPSP